MVKAKKTTTSDTPVKKTPTKKSPKAAKKTTKKKAAAKQEKKAPAKKDGLRKPQVRVLKALGKSKKPLSRAAVADKAPVDRACCVEYIGSPDADVRKRNDKKKFPSLVTLGLVKQEQHDIDGKDTIVHSLTSKGRKALAKLS
jgi:hypothetical protein